LLFSSASLSRQFQPSLSTAAAVTAEAEVAFPMAVAEVAFRMAVGDLMVASGLLAEEVTTAAAAFVVDRRRVVRERAAVRTAGL